MTNKYIEELENKLHGYHTRLKELHFGAPSVSIHKIIDDFDGALMSYEDEIMEDAQAVFGNFEVGQIQPVLPESTEILELLQEIRGTLSGFFDFMGTSVTWSGIRSETETFWHVLNKTIYLIKLNNGGE